ncbi:MAG: type II toxin-antitoxin system HicB family antitoxin [Chloroflexi bacterium]|nr:type II toxin-antitoxin system HicB family antitoxin [Chloroflexota bacterium]
MKLYRLPAVLFEPSEETESKYMAEVPALPGCRAWGDTAADALGNLQSVAAAFIDSYKDRGDSLPPDVEVALVEQAGPRFLTDVLVAV